MPSNRVIKICTIQNQKAYSLLLHRSQCFQLHGPEIVQGKVNNYGGKKLSRQLTLNVPVDHSLCVDVKARGQCNENFSQVEVTCHSLPVFVKIKESSSEIVGNRQAVNQQSLESISIFSDSKQRSLLAFKARGPLSYLNI